MNQNRDNVSQRERMLAGLPYKPWLDGLEEERTRCKEKSMNSTASIPGTGSGSRSF